MHLTNYAINRDSGEKNPEEVKENHCKKSLCDLHKLLTSTGISITELWTVIDGIIVKTILSALPTLQHLFHTAFPISTPVSSCFELLGFDILLDSRGKPYLLEVNRSPSLGASSPLDQELKQSMIRNVLNMVLLTSKQINMIKREQHLKSLHRLTNPNVTRSLTPKERILAEFQEQKEIKMMGNFRMLYPVEDDSIILSPNYSLEGKEDDSYGRWRLPLMGRERQSLNGHYLLDFYPHEYLNNKLRVTAATLWIQLRYSPSLPVEGRAQLRNKHVTLYAFRVGNSTEQLSHVTSYHQGTAHAGWRRLDVGEVVQQWLSGSDNRDKLTLLVDCTGCNSKLEMVLFNDDDPASNHVTATTTARRIRHGGHEHQLLNLRPFLAIATDANEQRRSRRHARTCGENPTYCCRQNLYVNFKELGWGDWIIAPKGYYANFCMGSCVGRRGFSYHNFHTHIIEEYRNRNPYASIHPCCAPTRLSSMSLIYFDTDLNIIKTDLPKMIVDECGCT
ncbi:Inhibin beta chain like protein [Argiope bruennichi]|uniref:Inhibin beta chain like protein n=1 Tax=Argiope bruennichi TaxID=94029 RepID=A0A8T0EUX1_ARGBR|nr:Inhibin beta chain like protein [Argiope bruennichi]